jgi:TM2 domain-containing membrane protein YozV
MNGSQDEMGRTMPEAPATGTTGQPVPQPNSQAPPVTAGVQAAVSAASARWGSLGRKSPVLASFLSLMPGLGQVYVGYYRRGFIHAAVIASIITLLASDIGPLTPLFALFMAFFWLYNIIDAGRRAGFYNHAMAGGETMDMPSDFPTPGMGGSIIGGLILIGAGGIFLSHTVWGISLTWMEDWWPAGLILFGVYLLGKAIFDRAKSAEK